MTIKIAYHFFNKQLKVCGTMHSIDLRNLSFHDYIRGTIIDDELYLRAFYPFNQSDIQDMTLAELYDKSSKLLRQAQKELLASIDKNLHIKVKHVVFNADKDLLAQDIA
jgi:hypothetical protein